MKNTYLLCELNDEDYAYAKFSFYKTHEQAIDAAILACVARFDGNCEIETANSSFRITSKQDNTFYVTEIKRIEVEGTHLLVWHHGYEGVDFKILYQGTYDQCVAEEEKKINCLMEELECTEDDRNDNIIDTGIEWEVFDIIEIND